MVTNPRIIVALDFEDIISAEKLVAELKKSYKNEGNNHVYYERLL